MVTCPISCSKRNSVDGNIKGRWINVETKPHTLIISYQISEHNQRWSGRKPIIAQLTRFGAHCSTCIWRDRQMCLHYGSWLTPTTVVWSNTFHDQFIPQYICCCVVVSDYMKVSWSGSTKLPIYQHKFRNISTWTIHYIYSFMWDITIYPFHSFNGGLNQRLSSACMSKYFLPI